MYAPSSKKDQAMALETKGQFHQHRFVQDNGGHYQEQNCGIVRTVILLAMSSMEFEKENLGSQIYWKPLSSGHRHGTVAMEFITGLYKGLQHCSALTATAQTPQLWDFNKVCEMDCQLSTEQKDKS
jgi:hypothetical protein